MTVVAVTAHPDAAPLFDAGPEAASRFAKVIVATQGDFALDGYARSAFLVGPRATPIAVRYGAGSACREWTVPAWALRAFLDVRGGEVSGEVIDLAELPPSPFVRALRGAENPRSPDPMGAARAALDNWNAGRRDADARIAMAAWTALSAPGSRTVEAEAASVGVGVRRLEQVMRREVGLSPKAVQRLARHERARRLLAASSCSLAEAALAAGYADQSHMTREVSALSGASPSRLRQAMMARTGSSGSFKTRARGPRQAGRTGRPA